MKSRSQTDNVKGPLWIIQMCLYQYLPKLGLELIDPEDKVLEFGLFPCHRLIRIPKKRRE